MHPRNLHLYFFSPTGGTQHVACRDLRNAEAFADELGLRAFAGARRSDEDKTHCENLLIQ